jgi:1-pyrroline-5-carboxylate dehydrogenase
MTLITSHRGDPGAQQYVHSQNQGATMLNNYPVPVPYNEPIRAYAPGSTERAAIKAKLAEMRSKVIDIPLLINGEEIHTETRRDAVIPHKHSHVLAHCSLATPDLAEKAIAGAEEARKAWADMPFDARAAIFLRAADLLAGPYRDEVNAATMLGQSKTVFQAEIDAACELADFWRFNVYYARRIMDEQPINPAGMWNQLQYRGLEGFVFAVSPFNFTSIGGNLPTSPVLMGCSAIWKPATTAIYSNWVLMKVLREAGMPAGVIQFLPFPGGSCSDAIFKSPYFAGVHFTGSTAVFNNFWRTIGENMDIYRNYPRIVGETGGKDFIFAHASSNVKQLATAIVRGAFEYQGQKCSAASRGYIPASIWPALKEELFAQLAEVKMGDVEDFGNFMGAVIDKNAYRDIKGYIDHAREASDAEIIFGGGCDDSVGYFIEPTLIKTSNPKFKSMEEEIFGPVFTFMVYEDAKFEETLAIADATSEYALTGAVFGDDREAVMKAAHALKNAAGNFYINDKPTGAVVGQQPFGGARKSGTNDKAGSMYNLLRWTNIRTVKETFCPATHFSYPFLSSEE